MIWNPGTTDAGSGTMPNLALPVVDVHILTTPQLSGKLPIRSTLPIATPPSERSERSTMTLVPGAERVATRSGFDQLSGRVPMRSVLASGTPLWRRISYATTRWKWKLGSAKWSR